MWKKGLAELFESWDFQWVKTIGQTYLEMLGWILNRSKSTTFHPIPANHTPHLTESHRGSRFVRWYEGEPNDYSGGFENQP